MPASQLKLKTKEVLQGDFKIEKLNLLFVFQVNCPGCFLQAFPIANLLYENYSKKGLKILGLSTAFENFDLNTLENTKRLIEKGELTGEAKLVLNRLGHKKLPFKISFDVAFDLLTPRDFKNVGKEAEDYCRHIDGFDEASQDRKNVIRAQLKKYFLDKKFTTFTFEKNKLQGTPAWILFNQEFQILYQCFGNQEYAFFQNLVNSYLPKA